MKVWPVVVVASAVMMLGVRPVCGAVPGAELLAGLIMSQFDSNSDGVVDAGEWQGGTERGFDEIDQNGDGSISGEEIDALKSEISKETGELGASVAVVLIKQVVMTLDRNDDKLVTRKEYAEGCAGILKKIDANSDGSVSKTELIDLPVRLLKGA